MKGSIQFPAFLLLALLVTAQGIRLQPLATPSTIQEIHEKGESRLVEGIDSGGGVVRCKDGECSGRSRKLMTNTKSMSKNIRNEGVATEDTPGHYSSKEIDGNQENKSLKSTLSAHPISRAEHHPDVMDLAAMDYTLVRRRTPIHN